MMNPHVDDHDQMMLLSQYYPDGIITQLVEEVQGGAVEKVKGRRRRRKNKGEEGGGDMMRKRKLSEEQVNMLEKSFGSEHKLESERKELLAAELQMDPRQVAVWFQNRRARWKTKKLEEEYSKLRSQHESTIVEKCRLETEIISIKEQLNEAEKEIQRLLERGDGFTSNSPSSSLSMDTNMDPPFLGELGMEGLPNVFYMPEDNYAHCLGWDDNIYSYM